MTAIEILTDALALLRERGWGQGKYECGNRICSAGAIFLASGVRPGAFWLSNEGREAMRLLAKTVSSDNHRGEGTVLVWNDEQATSFAEVEAAFIAAGARE